MNTCGVVNADNYSAQFLLLSSLLPDNFHSVRETGGVREVSEVSEGEPDVMRESRKKQSSPHATTPPALLPSSTFLIRH